jgi:MFS family permease
VATVTQDVFAERGSVPTRELAVPASASAAVPAEQVELFTDAKSGLWAAATTAFCVAAAAAGNLALLAASLGSAASPTTQWRLADALVWGLAAGAPLGVVVGLLRLVLPVASWPAMRQRWGVSVVAASVASAAGCMFVTLLYGVAWRSAVGSLPFAWQPVVGLTMSVVAMASFGGYYLASRRSRVGFAASFVLTFLVLLSFMLTLDGLARAVAGSDAGEGAAAAAKVVQDLLSDFRSSVALIVGFYFGTDAAVSVVKMFRTSGRDPEDIARLDRDLAVPHPGRPGEDAAHG